MRSFLRDRRSIRTWSGILLIGSGLTFPGVGLAQESSPQLPLGVEEKIWKVEVGIRIVSNGRNTRYQAGTPVPVEFPEQSVELIGKDYERCKGRVRSLGKNAAILAVDTSTLGVGEQALALHRYKVRRRTIPPRFQPTDFPDSRPAPSLGLRKFLRPTPGIESTDSEIIDFANTLVDGRETDLEKLRAFFRFVHEDIEYRMGDYTSTKTALETRIGDCEEKASLFIAFARTQGIPARTVWVPEHCWAEFNLVDRDGNEHWLPAHTSGYPWFGEIGSVEVIMHKGDQYRVPGSGMPTRRTLNPFCRGTAPIPQTEFILEVEPWSEPTLEDIASPR